ncbi:MAG: ATP-binding cassette domain-containing protein [Saccharospirillaceae bacterium]|nr:ATP-binding cassette domain-containing protein [Pseudomonadales bacterium]NRB80952.1 ATP-binding cassette domain-containing protein [Saccharospirillaceae bacterium]
MLEFKEFQLFINEVAIFEPISMTISNEIVSIMGPSGCGKSSLFMAVLGGLNEEFSYQGDIEINGESIMQRSTAQRHIGMMMQDDLLFPHMNVMQNLLFACPEKMKKIEKLDLINRYLIKTDMYEFKDSKVQSLSGGQKSRISALRAVLCQPEIVLLDEPFAKLDQSLKQKFRPWLFDLLLEKNIPVLMVTHDLNDCHQSAFYDLVKGEFSAR